MEKYHEFKFPMHLTCALHEFEGNSDKIVPVKYNIDIDAIKHYIG